MIEKVTRSSDETIAFAREIARKLQRGTVIALQGDLGAGKTTFVKGLALGFGLKKADEVKSPTFALMHTYESSPVIYHFDLYRLETEKEIANIGFEEFLADPQAVICVEWPERGAEFFPKTAVRVNLKALGPDERKITVRF